MRPLIDLQIPLIKTVRPEYAHFYLLLPKELLTSLDLNSLIDRPVALIAANINHQIATHIIIDIDQLSFSLQQWLKIHQEAMLLIDDNIIHANLKILIEAYFKPCLPIDDQLHNLPEGILILFSNGLHLFINPAPAWQKVASLIKPVLDLTDIRSASDTAPLLKLRLIERVNREPMPINAILVDDKLRTSLKQWVLTAPSQILKNFLCFRSEQFDILIKLTGNYLPPVIGAKTFTEMASIDTRKLFIMAQYELAPKLPKRTLLDLCKIDNETIAFIFSSDNNIAMLSIKYSEFKPLTRTIFSND